MKERLRFAWLASAVAVGLVAVVLAACPDPCANCPGCCADGRCLSGNAPGACGRGGSDCVACGAGRVCSQGACADGPDGGTDAGRPQLCRCVAGCCGADGGCAPGNLPEACGATGRYCVACPAGSTCPTGTCAPVMPCPGCLDALGLCREGSDAFACGRGGVPCQACIGTDSCVSGRCTGMSSCNATNCPSGCCANANICVPWSSAQCGVAGAPCISCPDGGTCVTGVCQ